MHCFKQAEIDAWDEKREISRTGIRGEHDRHGNEGANLCLRDTNRVATKDSAELCVMITELRLPREARGRVANDDSFAMELKKNLAC